MTRDDMEDVYSKLCRSLTKAGEENTSIVLARLTMLLLQEIDDAAAASALIEKAAAGYGSATMTEREGGVSP